MKIDNIECLFYKTMRATETHTKQKKTSSESILDGALVFDI